MYLIKKSHIALRLTPTYHHVSARVRSKRTGVSPVLTIPHTFSMGIVLKRVAEWGLTLS